MRKQSDQAQDINRKIALIAAPSLFWNAGLLETIGSLISGTVMRGVREMPWRPPSPSDWRAGRTAQDAVFGALSHPSHAFAADPFSWIRPSEPQITQGWRYFLTDRRISSAALRARQISFLRAALGIEDEFELPGEGDRVEIEAEARGRNSGRARSIDLVIHWKNAAAAKHAIAVEFKFGHHVTSKQLPDYRAIMKRRVGDAARMRLVVVLADHRSYPVTKRRAKGWTVRLWHDLLQRMEKQLQDDDHEFARFRHAAWQRAAS